ncbi:MAG: hypothetical protein ACLVHY_05615 [Gemmiger sp.]
MENNTVYAVEKLKGMTLTHYLKLRAHLTPVEANLAAARDGGWPAPGGRADPPRHLPG